MEQCIVRRNKVSSRVDEEDVCGTKAFKGKMLKSKQKLVDIEAEMKKRGLK